MARNEGSAKGLTGHRDKGADVVQPGLTSGEFGGLKNPRKKTPDAGDKPSKNKKSVR